MTESRGDVVPYASEDEDDEKLDLFLRCSENRMNAAIEAFHEINETMTQEFVTEAVSVAIQQHGLRKTAEEPPRESCGRKTKCSESSTDSDSSEPSESKKKKKRREEESEATFGEDLFADFDILNEAVSVAISSKGLTTTPLRNVQEKV